MIFAWMHVDCLINYIKFVSCCELRIRMITELITITKNKLDSANNRNKLTELHYFFNVNCLFDITIHQTFK